MTSTLGSAASKAVLPRYKNSGHTLLPKKGDLESIELTYIRVSGGLVKGQVTPKSSIDEFRPVLIKRRRSRQGKRRRLERHRERNSRLAQSASQIRSLNEQLGRKVQDRDKELSVVRRELERERGRYDYGSIVGASDEMKRVFGEVDRIIESAHPVLIHGESGTGKELIARAIHFNGERKERPFIAENCAALPDSLLESELFGHTRGAFTGADRSKKGLVEQASGV